MTYTIAQNLLINSKAQYRSNNYGKHPIEVFDIDQTIINNKTYNNIIKSLEVLESNYDQSLEEIDLLILEAQNNYNVIKNEIKLLNLLPTYTYTIPNKDTYIAFINDINTLVEDCNKVLNSILNNTLNNLHVYTNQLIINEVGNSINAIVTKQWLSSYFNTVALIPKVKPENATLVCDSSGEIKWQE